MLKIKYLLYFSLVLFFASCSQTKDDSNQDIVKSESSIVKKHEPILKVKQQYKSEIEDWKEYELFNNFIQQFISISPNEALNNSRELNGLTLSLRDSVKPIILETPAFNARINLLLNETLRLYDLSSIPIIKPKQVNEQVEKVLNSFSSLNTKINTTILQSILESDVVDVSFKRIKDSTLINEDPKINSTNKRKAANKKNQIKRVPTSKKSKLPTKEEFMKNQKGKIKRPKKTKDNVEKAGD